MYRSFMFIFAFLGLVFSCEKEIAENKDEKTENLVHLQVGKYVAAIRGELSNLKLEELHDLARQDFSDREDLERLAENAQLNSQFFLKEAEEISQMLTSLSYSANKEALTKFLEKVFREVLFEDRLVARGVPCYEAYQNEMNAAALQAAACVGGFGGHPAAIVGCTVMLLADEAAASSNYNNCIHSNYGG